MTTNSKGLAREIPEDVKRVVRGECGNGCVICGALPYEYEHFDPPFAEATSHDPAGIALLCPTCHRDKTAGRLSIDLIKKRRIAPRNVAKDATWLSHIGPGDITLRVGGNVAKGQRAGFQINDTPVLVAHREPGSDEWFLTGSLVGPARKETIRFVRNEVTVVSGSSWDAKFEGKELTVRDGPGDIVARLSFDADAMTVSLDRLKMPLAGGRTIEVFPDRLEIRHPDGKLMMTMGGNSSNIPGAAVVAIGAKQANPAAYSIAIAELGNLNDWLLPVSGSANV